MCSITTHSNKRGVISWIILSVISWIILSHFRLCFFSPLMGGNHIQTYFSSLHNFPYHSLRIDCIVIVTSVVVVVGCASTAPAGLLQAALHWFLCTPRNSRLPAVSRCSKCQSSCAVQWQCSCVVAAVSNNSTVFTVHILHTTMASPAADIGEVTCQHILPRCAPTLQLHI